LPEAERLRILLVANTLPPRDVSGVGEQVVQLAAGLRERGHDARVLGRKERGVAAAKVLFPLTVLASFVRELGRFRPHVVQVHESDGALAALALRVLQATCVPSPLLVSLLQVSYVEERRAVRTLRWEDRVLGRPGGVELRFRLLKAPFQIALGCLTAWLSELVLAPSAVTAAEISRDYAVDEVMVVPNATGGVIRPQAAVDDLEEWEDALLFVGRLRIRKGVEVLLEALSRLAKGDRRRRLLIVGDGEQRRSLERSAARAGLGSTVVFAGRRSPAEVRFLLSRAGALVVPSLYEGMPLVVLEAMEQGLPVVASAVSGIPEVVVDGQTGWLVPPEDPERLAAALAELFADPAEARRRGAAGRARVERLYRPAMVAETWERHVLARVAAG
jgi:glycosyltransferase involved in cell wall biosynthesis